MASVQNPRFVTHPQLYLLNHWKVDLFNECNPRYESQDQAPRRLLSQGIEVILMLEVGCVRSDAFVSAAA